MKRTTYIALAFTFLLSLTAVPVAVFAQTDEANDSTVTTQNTEVEVDDSEGAEKKQDRTKKSREERLAEAKEKQQARLDVAEQKRLEGACKGAQAKLAASQARLNGLITSRTQVYENLTQRLVRLQERLQTEGVDTTELDAALAELQVSVDTFKTDFANFEVTLTDVAEMDCEADVEAFKAALTQAREDYVSLKDNAKNIKALFKDTLKPILENIKSQRTTDQEEQDTSPEEASNDVEEEATN